MMFCSALRALKKKKRNEKRRKERKANVQRPLCQSKKQFATQVTRRLVFIWSSKETTKRRGNRKPTSPKPKPQALFKPQREQHDVARVTTQSCTPFGILLCLFNI